MNLAGKLDRLRGQVQLDECKADSGVQHRLPMDNGSDHDMASSGLKQLAQSMDAMAQSAGYVLKLDRCSLDDVAASASTLNALPEVYDLREADWVYLDTETTGLSGGVGNMAFMVGVARLAGENTLVVRQYLLSDFASEAAMLADLIEWLGPKPVLVTYNGKCFDLPLLLSRLRLHRLPDELSNCSHLDLMFGVRRAYRDRWPDCRLQTVERRRLGVFRVDDLPGAEAPAAWHAWLRQRRVGPLRRVLAHNAQDVVSLALLHRALVSDSAAGTSADLNHAAVGRGWLKAGHVENALAIWETAGARLGEQGSMELAATYRRVSRWKEAESLWLRLHAGGSQAAALELSKYYEHQVRDYQQALEFAAHCESHERHWRSRRLRARLGRNLCLFPGTDDPVDLEGFNRARQRQ